MKIATLLLCVLASALCLGGGVSLIVLVKEGGAIAGGVTIGIAALIIAMYLALLYMERHREAMQKRALIALKKRYSKIRERE